MQASRVTVRFFRFLLPLLVLGSLTVHLAVAAPITPPSTLNPPIPPNAIDPTCVETGAGITCTYQQEFPAEPAPHPFVNCGAFQTFEQGTGTSVDVTRSYDLSGVLTQEIRRVSYGGDIFIDTQPEPIGTREGRFTATIDRQAGVITRLTFTGLTAQVMMEGHGVVALDAGRVVIDPITNTVLSAAGRHDFIFPGLFGPGMNLQNAPANTQVICAALG